MARKTIKTNRHDFTRQIHSTRRANTEFANMNNFDERYAKLHNRVCCHDCRFFDFGCYEYIGKYHKTCNDFKWW